MFKREDVEQMLAVNGVPPTAPDEQIKQLLIDARWNKNDVDTAITVLRENQTTHKQRVDKLHKIFYSDDRLQPETVSALLGIETHFKPHDTEHPSRRPRSSLTAGQIIRILIVSIALSLLLLLFMMWYMQTGLFYSI